MPLNIGEVNSFIVKRETDISYTLSPDDDALTTYVFLHFNQATRKLTPGEKIRAFLYYDGKKRLCATMETTFITTHQYGFVQVVNVLEAVGVFVNIGISKDILLSKDFLPSTIKGWPKIGETLPCILIEKSKQLVAMPLSRKDIKNKVPLLNKDTTVSGVVVNIVLDGITICTNEYQFIFIYKSFLRKNYHIGENVTCKIVHINEHGHYFASTIEQKEYARLTDSDTIYHYLQNMGGIIPLGNNSTPEEINKYFKMSKSAFKRAVGALYKQRLITIEDNLIRLIDSSNI